MNRREMIPEEKPALQELVINKKYQKIGEKNILKIDKMKK